MHVDRPDLIETFPLPLALVSSSGVARECNAAFRELARSCSRPLELGALFGPDVQRLLAGASHTRLEATLPLATRGAARRWFRVTLSPHEDGETWTTVLADVTEETAFRRRHRDCDREFQILREIGAALSGRVELGSITEAVCEQVARLTRTRSFYVAIYDRERNLVAFPRYLEEGAWREKISRPFSNGLTEHVLRTRAPLLLDGDVFARARELGIEPQGSKCRAWLGVPMLVDGEAVGAIAVQSADHEACFDEHDLALLGVIASQAAAAVKHAGLLWEARRAYEELSQAQQKLLESERVRGITEAVGAMNHEINNPLAAIVGNAQLLLRSGDPAAQAVAPKIESILGAARRIQEVTGKMSTLIQATSMPYPGATPILDLRRSVSQGDTCALIPTTRPKDD